jgi:hypothetical protein
MFFFKKLNIIILKILLKSWSAFVVKTLVHLDEVLGLNFDECICYTLMYHINIIYKHVRWWWMVSFKHFANKNSNEISACHIILGPHNIYVKIVKLKII